MLTNSCHVDSVEKAFHLALELELPFKGIFVPKAWEQYSKCEGHGKYDYQCPRRVDMLILCLVIMLTTRGLFEDVYIPSEITNIVEDTFEDTLVDLVQ